jgi:hypothetical protein
MFRIGQKVVCIKNKMDNGAPRHPRVDYPEVGGVYTVAAAWTGKDGKALLQFDELRSPKKYRKWASAPLTSDPLSSAKPTSRFLLRC